MKDEWKQKWSAAQVPVYLVYVHLEKAPPPEWIEHEDSHTVVHALALWARVNSVTGETLGFQHSRLTAETFAGGASKSTSRTEGGERRRARDIRTARSRRSLPRRHGLAASEEIGERGGLWRHPTSRNLLPVPNELAEDGIDWQVITERVAMLEDTKVADIAARLGGLAVDIANLRAAKDLVIRDTMPYVAAVTLVQSSWTMLRSSATTAPGAACPDPQLQQDGRRPDRHRPLWRTLASIVIADPADCTTSARREGH